MTHKMVTRSGMPESRMRDRYAFFPGAPLNDKASGLRAHLQLLGDRFGSLAGRDLVLSVRPRDVAEEPPSGTLARKGVAADSRHRVGIDETLLELKRLLVTEMEAANRQHCGARRHAEQRTVIGIMRELTTFEQAILIGATAARDDVRDVPDLENGTLEGALRDDRANAASALNETLAGKALYCPAHRHA